MSTDSKWNELFAGEVAPIGPVTINVDWLVKNWDEKCWLSEWRQGRDDDFGFIRYYRLGSTRTTHKFSISREQANELIAKLSLEPTKGFFNNSYSWRKHDWDMITLKQRRESQKKPRG